MEFIFLGFLSVFMFNSYSFGDDKPPILTNFQLTNTAGGCVNSSVSTCMAWDGKFVDEDEIDVKVPYTIDITKLFAVFKTDKQSQAYVNGELQYINTQNNFTIPVDYKIVSPGNPPNIGYTNNYRVFIFLTP